MRAWLCSHKYVLAIKATVGTALVGASYFPEHVPALLVNLIWLVFV
jgi:hypothetical protein